MSTVILPLFHFKVAQCGIYSQMAAFRRLLRSAALPPLSRKASNFKWLEYRCQAICICAQHQKHLKVETLDGVLCTQAQTFMLKGKLAQTKSPHSLLHIHYIHFYDEPALTFRLLVLTPIIWFFFSFPSGGLAVFSTSATKQRKETCLGVINPRLFGLLTLTFPHISLPLFFVNPYCSHSLRLADTLTAVC